MTYQAAPAQTFLDYDLEPLNDHDGPGAYRLWGPAGEIYELRRYRKSPEVLYVVDVRNGRRIAALAGHYTFTDRAGHLEPLEPRDPPLTPG